MLGQLGRGNEAEVQLALTSSGLSCAIKFYHFRESRLATIEMRNEENKIRLEIIQKARDREYGIWMKLYKHRHARKVELAGRPCLQMPYGKPLSKTERESRFDEIKQELLRFFKEGFMYGERDFRWRHVLKDYKNQLFLTDLSSLTVLSSVPNIPKEVWTSKVVKGEKGRLFVVEKTCLDANDSVGRKILHELSEGIELFRGRGFQNNTSQMELTGTPANGRKQDRKSRKRVSISPLSSSKNANQKTA